ncbi:MAG: hypothetical protein DYG89_02745 [Caldilinea sp. CFX5]|nr:hypothetical protein [Caldilinea sp. CFX5]
MKRQRCFAEKSLIVLLVVILFAACAPAGQPAAAPADEQAAAPAADANEAPPASDTPFTFTGVQPSRCDPRQPTLTPLESQTIEVSPSDVFPGATVAIVEYTNEDGHRFRLEVLSFAKDAGENYLRAAQVCFEAIQSTGEEFASIPLYPILYNTLLENTPLNSFSTFRRQRVTYMAAYNNRVPTLENLLQEINWDVQTFYSTALDMVKAQITEANANGQLTNEEAEALFRNTETTYQQAIFAEDVFETFEDIAAIPSAVILVNVLSEQLGLSIDDLISSHTEYIETKGVRPSIAQWLTWRWEQGFGYSPDDFLPAVKDFVQSEIIKSVIIPPKNLLQETIILYSELYNSPTAFALLLQAATDPRAAAQLASKQKIGFEEFLQWVAEYDAKGELPSLAEEPITDGFLHFLYADPENLAISIEWMDPPRSASDNYVVFFVIDPTVAGGVKHFYYWRLETSVKTGVSVTGNAVNQRLSYIKYSTVPPPVTCTYRDIYIDSKTTTQQQSAADSDGVVYWLKGSTQTKNYFGTQVKGLGLSTQQNKYNIFGSWRDTDTRWTCQ